MTTWNYRLMKYSDNSFGMHEVYQSDGGKLGWTERAVGIIVDSPEEVLEVFEMMRKALAKPVLDYDTGKEI